jgi:catechol 2,3-dioxygenase-like lactoylglutathione lyase family enzyme
MIVGVHHVAISTGNLDRLVQFYRDVVGFELAREGGWPKGTTDNDNVVGLKDSSARVVMMHAGNCYLEIFEYSSPVPKPVSPTRPVCDHGYTHFSLGVTDIDKEYERMKAAGMQFHCPPPRREGQPVRATYGRDPDGNVVEILEVFSDKYPCPMIRSAA